MPIQLLVDQMNESVGRIMSCNVLLAHSNMNRLESLNSRWKNLQRAVDGRFKLLEEAISDHGSAQQNFLSAATESPFERAVSMNKVPYYINHSTETTSWDHPRMTDLMSSLTELNDIRYSAYRTGMKLRTVQRKLCLDLVTLEDLNVIFDEHRLRGQNDQIIQVPEIISCLQNMFEKASVENTSLFNIPLVIDLTLNWLLNLYDT